MQITNNLQIPIEIELIKNPKVFRERSSLELEEFRNNEIMEIQPEQVVMIPLKACSFDQVRMRPYLAGRREEGLFEWTDKVDISLL